MAAKEQLYTCNVKSKYVLEVTCVKNIEDCLDVAYTHEELKDTFGIEEGGWRYGLNVVENTLQRDLEALYHKAKSDNKKSFDISDEMLEALRRSNKQFKEYLPCCTLRNLKVFLNDEVAIRTKRESTTTKKRNIDIVVLLVCQAQLAFNRKHKFQIGIQYVRRDPKKALMFVKTLVHFEDLEHDMCKTDECKNVWDNVETLVC